MSELDPLLGIFSTWLFFWILNSIVAVVLNCYALQESSKSYSSTSIVRLFQHPLYYHQQGFYLLLLLWIWMTQNLLCYIWNIYVLLMKLLHDCCCSLLDCTWSSQCLDTLHYLFGYYLTDAVSEFHTIFQCYLLIIFVYICAAASAHASQLLQFPWKVFGHPLVTVTETCLQHQYIEFNLFTCFIYSIQNIIYFIPL